MSCLIIFYNHNTRVLQKCMLWVQFYNAEADSQLGLLSSCFPWLNKISHGSATWTCSSPNYTTARARGGAGQPLQLQLWSQDWSYLQQHELYHKLFFFFFYPQKENYSIHGSMDKPQNSTLTSGAWNKYEQVFSPRSSSAIRVLHCKWFHSCLRLQVINKHPDWTIKQCLAWRKRHNLSVLQ